MCPLIVLGPLLSLYVSSIPLWSTNQSLCVLCPAQVFWSVNLCPLILLGPPSAPVNLISSVNGTTVTLEWNPPRDTGGRRDVTYNVICRRCAWDAGQCEPCGGGVRYTPQQMSLAKTSLIVANLQAHMNYTFWVEAVNGVSDFSLEQRMFSTVNITTNQAGRRLGELCIYCCVNTWYTSIKQAARKPQNSVWVEPESHVTALCPVSEGPPRPMHLFR